MPCGSPRRAPTSSTWAASRRGRAPSPCRRGGGAAPRAPRDRGHPRARRSTRAISVDTSKAAVAAAALDAGADYVNDVTALRGDPELAGARGRPRRRRLPDAHARLRRARCRTTRATTTWSTTVKAFLEERIAAAVGGGHRASSASSSTRASASARRSTHNLELIDRLDELVALGRPVVLGTSRKAFLGRITGPRRPPSATAATLATLVLGLSAGRACSASTTSRPRATPSPWRLLRWPRGWPATTPRTTTRTTTS